jgi:hypothetical protein
VTCSGSARIHTCPTFRQPMYIHRLLKCQLRACVNKLFLQEEVVNLFPDLSHTSQRFIDLVLVSVVTILSLGLTSVCLSFKYLGGAMNHVFMSFF